jgi:hypothetical protein
MLSLNSKHVQPKTCNFTNVLFLATVAMFVGRMEPNEEAL